jgi:hypothetical protein
MTWLGKFWYIGLNGRCAPRALRNAFKASLLTVVSALSDNFDEAAIPPACSEF